MSRARAYGEKIAKAAIGAWEAWAMERKLAAILAADVVGYCRLMAADEPGTLTRLKALLKDIFEPKIAEHHGRVVKTTGDGLLMPTPGMLMRARGLALVCMPRDAA